ncbi:MAG: hypothetical protein INR71_15970, partial [Terriglobus roseus]|nr:hypothetical protein [Terriglobus roseus]
MDADVHLDWNQVLQILVSSRSQQVACPICLSHPTAPRMSKCGHIACLTCLLRYKQADDVEKIHGKGPKWVKCPICED